MFSLNGTLKKSGSVGRWETKQFIGMALVDYKLKVMQTFYLSKINLDIENELVIGHLHV